MILFNINSDNKIEILNINKYFIYFIYFMFQLRKKKDKKKKKSKKEKEQIINAIEETIPQEEIIEGKKTQAELRFEEVKLKRVNIVL